MASGERLSHLRTLTLHQHTYIVAKLGARRLHKLFVQTAAAEIRRREDYVRC